MLDSLLGGRVRVRRLPAASRVLPLERETLFLVLPGADVPVELTRPSSRLAVVEPPETDTGARLATLRARPDVDWLARADPVPDGRFADGSALVGVAVERGEGGGQRVTLFWQLPLAGDERDIGQSIRVTSSGGGRTEARDARLPPLEARRSGEIVVQHVEVRGAGPDGRVGVVLLAGNGRAIPTAGGAGEVVVWEQR
jgi:hypothetical protein